ncbi:MAG TPA: TetR/AcrR family transcriptional regulator [Tardiphaga sp.]
MDAGQRLFLEKGISGTSVDDVMADAGVAKGTFYLYFASKDELLKSLRERFVASYCEGLERAVVPAPRRSARRGRSRSPFDACDCVVGDGRGTAFGRDAMLDSFGSFGGA